MRNKKVEINKSLKDFDAQQQAQTFYPLFLLCNWQLILWKQDQIIYILLVAHKSNIA